MMSIRLSVRSLRSRCPETIWLYFSGNIFSFNIFHSGMEKWFPLKKEKEIEGGDNSQLRRENPPRPPPPLKKTVFNFFWGGNSVWIFYFKLKTEEGNNKPISEELIGTSCTLRNDLSISFKWNFNGFQYLWYIFDNIKFRHQKYFLK